eukprot:507674-Rhodomonas_salina.1
MPQEQRKRLTARCNRSMSVCVVLFLCVCVFVVSFFPRGRLSSVGIASSLLGSSIHVSSLCRYAYAHSQAGTDFCMLLQQVCANVSMALVLGYGGTLVLGGEMTAGGLTSFLLYSVYVGFNFGSLRCGARERGDERAVDDERGEKRRGEGGRDQAECCQLM